jgi:enoyl-CoA hydratase/carnithine racemase
MKGEGNAFCAGLDIKEAPLLSGRRVPEEFKKYKHIDVPELVKRTLYWQNRMGHIVVKMRKISQPIITLIQGPATGGGFTFAMASDIRLASESGRFSIGAINIGMSGGDLGGAYFLTRLIGMSRAAELMYTGRYLGAEEAEKIGFVLKVVKEDELLDTAMEIAHEMLTKSPLGLRMTKEAINISLDSPSLETMINLDNRAQTLCTTSKDFAISMQAFIEKKKPKFSLR